jgi:hypothetical protein
MLTLRIGISESYYHSLVNARAETRSQTELLLMVKPWISKQEYRLNVTVKWTKINTKYLKQNRNWKTRIIQLMVGKDYDPDYVRYCTSDDPDNVRYCTSDDPDDVRYCTSDDPDNVRYCTSDDPDNVRYCTSDDPDNQIKKQSHKQLVFHFLLWISRQHVSTRYQDHQVVIYIKNILNWQRSDDDLDNGTKHVNRDIYNKKWKRSCVCDCIVYLIWSIIHQRGCVKWKDPDNVRHCTSWHLPEKGTFVPEIAKHLHNVFNCQLRK